MKKTFLLTFFTASIIFIVNSSLALAECAWVLWYKEETISQEKSLITKWEILTAFPKYEQCLKAGKKAMGEKKEFLNRMVEVDSKIKVTEITEEGIREGIRIDHDNFLTIYRYNCLPETLDPRERKEIKDK